MTAAFWYRELAHFVGGMIVATAAQIGRVWGLGWQFELAFGALLAAAIYAKEMTESVHQVWYKTLCDCLFWLAGFGALVTLYETVVF